MRHQLVAGLCFAVVIALFARANGYNVKYDGGSLSDAKAGTELKIQRVKCPSGTHRIEVFS